jgi:hypothetical protein
MYTINNSFYLFLSDPVEGELVRSVVNASDPRLEGVQLDFQP